jgi:hypothetical protein
MIRMRKAVTAAMLGAVVLASGVRAQNSRSYWGYSQQIGSTTYSSLSGSDGSSLWGFSYRLGSITYIDLYSNRGSSLSGQIWRLGDTIYYDFRTSDGTTISGSSYRLGTLELHNISVKESPLSTLWRSTRTDSPKWPW